MEHSTSLTREKTTAGHACTLREGGEPSTCAASPAGQRGGGVKTGSHLPRLGGCGIGGHGAVDVLVRHHMAQAVGVGDQAACRFGRNRLAAELVMRHVALRATHALSQGRLGDAQAIADGFDVVHVRSICAANTHSQQRRCFVICTA